MKKYRITFRVEAYVDAHSEEHAEKIFQESDFREDPTAEFVELVSIEKLV